MNALRDRLVRCFAAVFPDLHEDEIRTASTQTVPTWDSVATVTLASLIEEEFQLRLSPESAPELVSFERIRAHLDDLLA